MTTGRPADSTEQPTVRHIEYLPLDEVLPAGRNPKHHDLEAIRAAIDRFGFTTPALLDERTGRLVVGHGRLRVLRQMVTNGEDPPAGVRHPTFPGGSWLVPVIRGWSSANDAEAEAYLVADNQLTILGGWDDHALARMLADLVDADAELARVAGFEGAPLEELLALLDGLPTEHDALPATDAHYAETAEEQAAREETIANYQPRAAAVEGFTEMILVYRQADRDEVGRLVGQVRDVLGADMRAGEIMLRALRVLVPLLEALRDYPGTAITVETLAEWAGWDGER